MKILIIGNGFDLAHNLPTTYIDYLMFAAAMKKLTGYAGCAADFDSEELSRKEYNTMHPSVRKFLLSLAQQSVKKDDAFIFPESWMDEYYRNANNIWEAYFQILHVQKKMNGIGWIDLESEIRYVIECFDRMSDNLYNEIIFPENEEDAGTREALQGLFRKFDRDKIDVFFNFFKDSFQAEERNSQRLCYTDLRDIAYDHLLRFARCFELYLQQCVSRIDVTLQSPDIAALYPNKVLSFNYTDTFDHYYQHATVTADPDSTAQVTHGALMPFTQYIHGRMGSGNIIFGIDEYGVGEERNKRVNYNVFKKFVERILFNTGFEYREWINDIVNREYPGDVFVYIFGHSLDITDKDILSDLIITEKVTTIIYYFSRKQQASQISNLIKMIGYDRFLKMINAVPPRIVFKAQQAMVPFENEPSRINIVKGDITLQEADCIINSTNNSLRGDSGVSNAIFVAAGYTSMKNACAEYGACATCACVVTPAFKLKAKYVIHTVGPIWKGGGHNEDQKLYECYHNILETAMKHDCHSLASPLISSGVHGYPMESFWPTAISACTDFFKEHPEYHFDVRFVTSNQENAELGKNYL